MNMTKYNFHPAANIFPIADGPELDALAADIQANGQHHPTILHEGKILDGRRRYLACIKAGVEPKFLAWNGKGLPLDYVISTNVHRRHLSSSQRAIVALRMLPLLAEEAKERQRQSNGRGKKGAQKCAGRKGKAASLAAELVNCCPRLVEQAKSIQATHPDLINQIESGELTISKAVDVLHGTPQRKSKRKANDLYRTPAHAIASLIAREAFHGVTWEPAQGDGRIVSALKAAGYEAFGTDISSGEDFLTTERQANNIVTNPPYSLNTPFIERALSCATGKVAMLLPLAYLAGLERQELIFNEDFPLKAVYCFPRAVNFDETSETGTGGMLYLAWYVWDKLHQGEPLIRRIHPNERTTPLPPLVKGHDVGESVIRLVNPNESATTITVEEAEEVPQSGTKKSVPVLPPPPTPPLRIAAHPDGFRPKVEYHCGDSHQVLRTLPAESVDCCVTSVPYYLLRDYECEGQYGLESSVGEWVGNLLNVFREVRRVLRDKGTCWINAGDPYAYGTGSYNSHGRKKNWTRTIAVARRKMDENRSVHPKSLMFAPHRLAVALAEDGWIGRAEIILRKGGVDGCKDRPVRSHEYLYLFTKTDDYYFDADCLRVPYAPTTSARGHSTSPRCRKTESQQPEYDLHPLGKLRGSIWNAGPASGAGDHPAPMPLQIAVDCIRAGCPEGGTVLDPFLGSGTTAVASVDNARHCIGIDLNRSYLDIALKRVPGAGMAEVGEASVC